MAHYTLASGKIKLTITEHAMIRYLERVHGLDVEQLLKEMIPKDILEIVNLCQGLPVNGPESNHNFFSCQSHTVVIREGTIVTVLAPDIRELPSKEWESWTTSAVLRVVPIEGTQFDTAIKIEVNRRVEDKAWQSRQESEAIKKARQQVAIVEKQFEQKEKQLLKQVSNLEQENIRLRNECNRLWNQIKDQNDETLRLREIEKPKSIRICERVKELLGPKLYAELEKEVK